MHAIYDQIFFPLHKSVKHSENNVQFKNLILFIEVKLTHMKLKY